MPTRRPRTPSLPPARPLLRPPAAAAGEPAPDQFTICTKLCGARCCRYLTVGVPAPRSLDDWDEVRWWLAHKGAMVTHDEDGWMLHVETPCQNLGEDNACGVYADRPLACEAYDPNDCEYTGDVPFDVMLRTERDLAAYLERRRLKRGRPVARAIRSAEHRRSAALHGVPVPAAPAAAPAAGGCAGPRPPGPTLVPLTGLAP